MGSGKSDSWRRSQPGFMTDGRVPMTKIKTAASVAAAPMDKSSQTRTPDRTRSVSNFEAAITTTSEPEKYDVLVLGSGTGGKLIGWTMAREGKRTAGVERKYIGGALAINTL